jgi:hypothetical protein
MMDPNHHLTQRCFICGVVEHGRFRNSGFYCRKHSRDEVEFHQSMPEDRSLWSKYDKALERIYAKKWRNSPRTT